MREHKGKQKVEHTAQPLPPHCCQTPALPPGPGGGVVGGVGGGFVGGGGEGVAVGLQTIVNKA